MTDMFGNPLAIGDIVATTNWVNRKTQYELEKAKVIGFTPKKIKIQYLSDNYITTKFSNQISKKYQENRFKEIAEAYNNRIISGDINYDIQELIDTIVYCINDGKYD